MKVDLDEVEDHPEKYVGRTVTTEGEVDRILGVNLFTIDEKDWVDAEREMPVVVPEGFVVLLKEDAPVRVTGTVQQVPLVRIEKRGRATDERIRAEIEKAPALVARRSPRSRRPWSISWSRKGQKSKSN